MDDKEMKIPQDKPADNENNGSTWVDDMKQELEDYIEEQGVYIRQ